MDDKARAGLKLAVVGVGGAVFGGLLVFFLFSSSNTGKAPVGTGLPDVQSKTPWMRPVDVAGSTAGKLTTEDNKVKAPGPDTRVMLSDTPADVRASLVPGPAPKTPWDPNERNEYTSMPKDELRQMIVQQQRVLAGISAGRNECLKKLREVKLKNDKENAEIIALEKEFGKSRKLLADRMSNLPDVRMHEDKQKEIQKEMELLCSRRQELDSEIREFDRTAKTSQTKTSADEANFGALTNKMARLNVAIQEKENEVTAEIMAASKNKQAAQESDPEIKALTAECIEKQHLLEAKRNQTPDVLEARKALAALDEQYQQAAAMNAAMHRALPAAVDIASRRD